MALVAGRAILRIHPRLLLIGRKEFLAASCAPKAPILVGKGRTSVHELRTDSADVLESAA
jgi:hypothetical protein